ncbi:PfkB family carbohydrate kinase [Microbacterium sp.]|uniref:PfkB family carbohydrate kinase n=1 Tax=Microbacterium sp. TaxID=51671 RepID=UPI00281212B1|nr:PfkB family carbohydrate kinase [Microbacterium sp.]
MPRSVLFVGAATYDAIAVVDHMPAADERLIASEIRYAGGGPAATAAVAAKRLGLEVELIAAIGNDDVGPHIQAGLAAEGISPALLQVEADRSSQASVILCSQVDATRGIATRGASPLRLTGPNRERVLAADWIHVDHLGWPAVAEVLADIPLDQRPRISVDAGHPLVGDAASACHIAEVNIYAPPMEKLVERYGDRPHDEILRSVPSHSVVATLGSGGSVGRDSDGGIHTSPGFVVPDLGSTLGAGDVFHGALTAAIVQGQPMPDAITYANAVAALSCRGVDGRSAIPDHDETIAFIRKERA